MLSVNKMQFDKESSILSSVRSTALLNKRQNKNDLQEQTHCLKVVAFSYRHFMSYLVIDHC